ncbi:MAG: uncharacterized protein QOF29_2363 [bacterium]
MKLEQSFTVAAPVEQVWATLIDVERIAPCLPGAEITGRDEDGAYQGSFSVKLGPTTAAYRGSLRMESIDEAARTATMSAKGTDKRGQGGASATIVSSMREAGGETHVDVVTDFTITGRLAGFGRSGMIEDISRRLMRDFADCLRSTITAEPAATAGGGSAPGAGGEAGAAAPVLSGDVPAEAAGGAPPSGDPDRVGTLGVPPPSEPGRQPPGTSGGAGGPEGAAEGAGDAADAALASAGGAAAEAATAGAAPPDAQAPSGGPAAPAPPPPADGPPAPTSPAPPPDDAREPAAAVAPAPPPDAGTPPPPPPGDPAGRVPTAGGAGGTPPPPPTGPPPPAGGRERGAPPSPDAPDAPDVPEPPAAPPEPPAPRQGSIPPPSAAPRPAPKPAKPVNGFGLMLAALGDRIKRLFPRKGKDKGTGDDGAG